MLYEVITPFSGRNITDRIAYSEQQICVITSYSIHYTKLYEKAAAVFRAEVFHAIMTIGLG